MGDDAQKQDVQADSSSADTQTDEQKSDEQSVPFSRFKEINDRLKEATQFVNWVRSTFESPEELVELAKMKREGTMKEKRAASEQEEELTEAQKAAVRKLVRMSDANLAKVAELVEQGKLKVSDEDEEEESLVDETESELLKIIKEKKLPTTDGFLRQLGRQIMMEITSDPKLYKQWQRGKTESVARQAFSRVEEEFLSPIRGGKSVLQTKQDIAKLPNLPSGGTGVSEKPKPKADGQGITKATHEAAFRMLQDAVRE